MRTLRDYEPILSPLLNLLAKQTVFTSPFDYAALLKKEARLIAVFNHATPLSWLPAMCLICKETSKAGGGNRVPLGIMDKFFYDFAPLRVLANFVTQSNKPLAFQDLEAHLKSFERADLCVFPEGSNCFFGDPREVQEFRSPRIIELSITSKIPILVGVHRGSENWATSFDLHAAAPIVAAYLPRALAHKAEELTSLTVPLLPKKMERFRMMVDLWVSEIEPEELSTDKNEKRAQLEGEARKLRLKMKEMLSELDSQALEM